MVSSIATAFHSPRGAPRAAWRRSSPSPPQVDHERRCEPHGCGTPERARARAFVERGLVALGARRRASALVGQRRGPLAVECVETLRPRHIVQRAATSGGAFRANGLGGSADRAPQSARCRRSTVAARGSASRAGCSVGWSCSSASTSSSPSHSVRMASSAMPAFPSPARHCSRRRGGVRPQPLHSSEKCRCMSRIVPGSSERLASVSAAAIAAFTDWPRPTIWLNRSRQ